MKKYEESVAKKQIEPDNLRTDELSVQQERNPAAVSQLLTQFQVRTRKIRCQPTFDYSESHKNAWPNFVGISGNVIESLLAREGPSSALFNNSRNLASSSCGLGTGTTEHITAHGRGARREPQRS